MPTLLAVLIAFATWADRRRLGGRRAGTAFSGWAVDVALALTVAAVDSYGAWAEAHSPVRGDPTLKLPAVAGWAYAFVAGAGLALAWRRKSPLASFVAVALLTFVYTALGYNDGAPFLALAVSLYSLATVVNPKTAWLAVAVAVVACEAALVAFGPFGAAQGPVTVVPWELAAGAGTGFFVASRRAQAARARERAEEESRRHVEDERLRIARELHDVIAHSMATINVQAGVALHLLRAGAKSSVAPTSSGAPGSAVVPARAAGPGNPVAPALACGTAPGDLGPLAGNGGAALERAVEAMEAVRATSKEALRELRGVLGLLRSTSEWGSPPRPDTRSYAAFVYVSTLSSNSSGVT